MCVLACVCAYIRVCVCVREKERTNAHECIYAFVCVMTLLSYNLYKDDIYERSVMSLIEFDVL